jgi:hypothetical protein
MNKYYCPNHIVEKVHSGDINVSKEALTEAINWLKSISGDLNIGDEIYMPKVNNPELQLYIFDPGNEEGSLQTSQTKH